MAKSREYKEWLRDQKDLLKLHRNCVKTELFYIGVSASTKLKFLKLYDLTMRPETIREYFFIKIRVFIIALVQNRLDEVKDLYPNPYDSTKPKKNKKK